MMLTNLTDFYRMLEKHGHAEFWRKFRVAYVHAFRPDLQEDIPKASFTIDTSSPIFSFDNLGELYELSLEHEDKISKKELGQYYTPKDVSEFMAKKVHLQIDVNSGDTLADVCCGTGNLIIAVLSELSVSEVDTLIHEKRLYLYDFDAVAMNIALMKIAILFLKENDTKTYNDLSELITICPGNFLGNTNNLPNNCQVISNPPYGRLSADIELWDECRTQSTKDLYSVFIDKIASQAKGAVIISPQSFLGGRKFTPLRDMLSGNGGKVYSFDNVPAPVFSGRKKGIFNTNTANSVRAAITVIDNEKPGFQTTPLIRFNAKERELVFTNIDRILGTHRYTTASAWMKIPRPLEELVEMLSKSNITVEDLIEKDHHLQNQEYKITIPTTPRYYISGSVRNLNRSSAITIFAKDQEAFTYLYALLNSSISYLWWRILDGGIVLQKTTLLQMPVSKNISSKQLQQLVKRGTENEGTYLVGKMNAGKNNENIKFPLEYRSELNKELCLLADVQVDSDTLMSIHANSFADVIPYWAK